MFLKYINRFRYKIRVLRIKQWIKYIRTFPWQKHSIFSWATYQFYLRNMIIYKKLFFYVFWYTWRHLIIYAILRYFFKNKV